MQPYLFPYLGYFQLANYCEKFVFYDDVNFIKGGFINRNYILANGKRQLFTVPVLKASSNSKIKDLHFAENRTKVMRTLEQNYRKAPYFNDVIPVLDKVFNSQENLVAQLCKDSVVGVFNYLGIHLDYCFSSEMVYNRAASAADKLYAICELSGANQYCNMENGKTLYNKSEFKENNIDLHFLAMKTFSYPQSTQEFVSHLSIIDVLMWNSKGHVIDFLNKYELS